MVNPTPPPASLWQRLIEPSPSVDDLSARHRARLLAALTLVYGMTAMLGAVAAAPFNPRGAAVTGGIALVSGLIYLLSRTPYYRWGTILFVVTLTGLTFTYALSAPLQTISTIIHIFVPLTLVQGAVLLSMRGQVTLTSANLLGIALLYTLIPELGFRTFSTMLGTILTLGAVLVIATRFRDQLEWERLGALSRANQELHALSAELAERLEELQVSEARFRTIFDATGDAIFIHDLESGAILDVNQRMLDMYGYTRQEALQLDVEALSAGVPPYTQVEAMGWIRKGELEGPQRFRWLAKRRDGTLFWCDISLRVALIDGQPRLLVVARDITQQVQAEEALRASEEKFSKAFASSPDSIAIATLREGRILELNQSFEQMYGYHREEALGRLVIELNIWKEETERQKLVEALQEHGTVRNMEVEFNTKDGRTITALMSAEVIELGGEPCLVAVTRDITPRKKAEEQIRRLNMQLEQRIAERTGELEDAMGEIESFSYSIAHDLRSPLRAMDGFARILVDEHSAELSPDARDYLERVRGGAQRMGGLIDDLLEFSRLSRLPLRRQTVDPAQVARQVLDELGARMTDRQVEILVAEMPPCQADPALLHRVYTKLLDNALKFTRQRPVARIEVGCEGQDGETVYFVRDNGVGFDMRYADKLFGLFQRLHLVDEFEGSGAGLAIVQRIVHRHGGRVWAQAEAGKGATFYFTIE